MFGEKWCNKVETSGNMYIFRNIYSRKSGARFEIAYSRNLFLWHVMGEAVGGRDIVLGLSYVTDLTLKASLPYSGRSIAITVTQGAPRSIWVHPSVSFSYSKCIQRLLLSENTFLNFRYVFFKRYIYCFGTVWKKTYVEIYSTETHARR